jgi:hypothetical protein
LAGVGIVALSGASMKISLNINGLNGEHGLLLTTGWMLEQ